MTGFVEQLRENAGVTSVYGEPIVAEGRTTVPVAKVAYGFGGGYGSGGAGAEDERPDRGEGEGTGEGGGLGGGVRITPVGVVEMTPDRTRFVRFGGRRRLVAAAALGLLAGVLLGRLPGRRGGD